MSSIIIHFTTVDQHPNVAVPIVLVLHSFPIRYRVHRNLIVPILLLVCDRRCYYKWHLITEWQNSTLLPAIDRLLLLPFIRFSEFAKRQNVTIKAVITTSAIRTSKANTLWSELRGNIEFSGYYHYWCLFVRPVRGHIVGHWRVDDSRSHWSSTPASKNNITKKNKEIAILFHLFLFGFVVAAKYALTDFSMPS